jgi:hypothetical protein
MKEGNIDFKVTIDSLNKLKDISKNMEGKTFHFYTHVLYDIRTHLGESEKTYLEIGSFAGGSVSLVSSHPYPTKCYSIDLGRPIPQEVVENNVSKFKNEKSTFKYFKGDSRDENVINQIKDEIDILFIDGDHSYDGALNDFKVYSKMVKAGGYIVFDDYNDYIHSPEVKTAVDDIAVNFSDEFLMLGTVNTDFPVGDLDNLGGNSYILKKKV